MHYFVHKYTPYSKIPNWARTMKESDTIPESSSTLTLKSNGEMHTNIDASMFLLS